MAAFKKVSVESLTENPFTLIGKDWMLITAGDETKYNTMTASWGGVGVLWNKPVSYIVVRPQRYTKEFIDAEDSYSLSFFDDSWRSMLNVCGTKSGRDIDKAAETGITPVFTEAAPYFEEAKLVLICKKHFMQPMQEASFLSPELLAQYYPEKDLHILYIGEIETVLIRDDA